MPNQSKFFKTSLIVYLGVSLLFVCGCQTLKKKFTRKPKAEKENVEEVIYAPQEYPAQVLSNEDMYRDYYALWRGWAQDLDEALVEGGNRKRQAMSITEMVNNLNKMKGLLTVEAQSGLDKYIAKILPIKDAILSGKASAADYYWMKIKLDGIKARIARDYLPRKVKSRLIP